MFNLITYRLVDLARNIGPEDQLTIRNVITHLDFDVVTGTDSLTYTNKDTNPKVMILYQISYVPKDANPQANTTVRRPYSLTVTKNANRVVSIQSIKEPDQELHPFIEIRENDSIQILIEGYDGSADIHIFGLVAESLGANMNG
jgi:hypothetical protein